jgi:undecaprenyl-diphosphatase
MLNRWKWRTLSILGALFLIALIGFSRLYLGVHYLSDVLGAYAEGVAWLAICFTGFETHRRSGDMLRPSAVNA